MKIKDVLFYAFGHLRDGIQNSDAKLKEEGAMVLKKLYPEFYA